MHKATKTFFAITLIIFLASCSWQEYFVISNTSQSEVIFNYTVEEVENGFPVFTNQPLLYKLNSSKEIDWNSSQIPQDLDTSLTGLKLKIPPNYAVVFGELSNEHYKAYNQTFINGRIFNLKELELLHSNDTIIIVPESFDTYFKKTNGTHKLEIK